jgi:23S rRNA (guanosine2251-2'-O)-methyltransferase
VEALWRARRRVVAIWLDERAREDAKVSRILELAQQREVAVTAVPRRTLDELCVGGVHNGVLAWAEPLPGYTTQGLLSELERENKDPFIVLVDEASYEHNLGAVMRSALGAGVHGVVVPVRRGKGLSPVVHRVSMGGAEVVPLIREGLSSSLATLRRAGVTVVGCDMDGDPLWDIDLTGPVAVVLGGEGKGLSSTLRARCDRIASVPLEGQLESLNLSVTAGVFLFERSRQLRQQFAAAAPMESSEPVLPPGDAT